MTLTNKQEAFCKAIALEGMNYSDAYREAYNASNMKPETIKNSAYKLMNNGDITATISELKSKIEAKVIEGFAKTKDDILIELENIKNKSFDDKTKIDCLKEQGKLLGYYVEQKKDLNKSEFKEWLAGVNNTNRGN